ncbi:MAG TPA: hypothetical protein VLM37_07885, partial [Fibrobacteraceae bacterium]|nr:hypothetical protein [Fibrobacteraceae bacterium]
MDFRLAVTALLAIAMSTSLYWKSNSTEFLELSQIIHQLAEFKYFDARLDRQLQAARDFNLPDAAEANFSMAVLHDYGLGYETLTTERRASSLWYPE